MIPILMVLNPRYSQLHWKVKPWMPLIDMRCLQIVDIPILEWKISQLEVQYKYN